MSGSERLLVEHLSKRFVRGGKDNWAPTFREAVAQVFKKQKEAPSREFWALDDVSFSLNEGDALALLGRNGAGKSTLLKILSRVSPPTRGRVLLRGALSSLLEVGTGFHAELTARENIFFNGALLGMSRKQIRHNFDAIVAFSGIEPFLDTPMKRFSSGMVTRLGFAIGTSLDFDLLLIDEVLSVGDVGFQKKAIGKLRQLHREGKTFIFVSHHPDTVLSLCNKGLVLENGKAVFSGEIEPALGRYLDLQRTESWSWRETRERDGWRLHRVELEQNGKPFFYTNEQTVLEIEAEMSEPTSAPLEVVVRDTMGNRLAWTRAPQQEAGRVVLRLSLDFSLFHPGEYQISVLDEVSFPFTLYRQDGHSLPSSGGLSLGNLWEVKMLKGRQLTNSLLI